MNSCQRAIPPAVILKYLKSPMHRPSIKESLAYQTQKLHLIFASLLKSLTTWPHLVYIHFKPQISSAFYFDWVSDSQMVHVLDVKHECLFRSELWQNIWKVRKIWWLMLFIQHTLFFPLLRISRHKVNCSSVNSCFESRSLNSSIGKSIISLTDIGKLKPEMGTYFSLTMKIDYVFQKLIFEVFWSHIWTLIMLQLHLHYTVADYRPSTVRLHVKTLLPCILLLTPEIEVIYYWDYRKYCNSFYL